MLMKLDYSCSISRDYNSVLLPPGSVFNMVKEGALRNKCKVGVNQRGQKVFRVDKSYNLKIFGQGTPDQTECHGKNEEKYNLPLNIQQRFYFASHRKARLLFFIFIYWVLFEFIGVSLVNKMLQVQIYSSTVHHWYVVFCVYHPWSSLLSSPFILLIFST